MNAGHAHRRARPPCAVAAGICLLMPLWALADASADSKGSDWWGTNSGWKWDWPGVTAKPGGIITGEYKHWFETGEPAGWTVHSPAIWSLPTAVTDFPFWPGSIVGTTGGDGAFSTDIHGCIATSDWSWEAHRSPIFQSQIVLQKGTIAYANAKSVPNVNTAAHSRTRLVDPWQFSNPSPGQEWSLLGRIAPQGDLQVSEGANESANAFFELHYAVAVDGGSPFEILSLHVGVDGEGPAVSLDAADGVQFYRNGVRITENRILKELTSFYGPDHNWSLGDAGTVALEGDYHFDVSYNMAADSSTATLFSTPLSGADDALSTPAIPEPGTWLLWAQGLGVVSWLGWRRVGKGSRWHA